MNGKLLSWTTRVLILFFAILITSSDVKQARNGSYENDAGSGDFIWDSSRAMLSHIDPYRENAGWIPIEAAKGHQLWATYAPSCIALILPFAVFDWQTAKNLWLIFNICASICIFVAIRKLWLSDIPLDTYLWFALLAYGSIPWHNDIIAGQQTLYSLCFFVLGYQQALAKRPIVSGVLLSLSLMKYTLTGPLVIWMGLTGFEMALATTVLLHSGLTLFACFWLGMSPWNLAVEYLKSVNGAAFQGCTDIFSFAHTFVSSDRNILIAFLFAGFSGLLCWSWRRLKRNRLHQISIVCMWSLLVVYHSEVDASICVFPIAMLFKDRIKAGWRLALAAILADVCYMWTRRAEIHLHLPPFKFEYAVLFFEIAMAFICLVFMDSESEAEPQSSIE